MRFETDVLTQWKCGCGCGMVAGNYQNNSINNSACASEIKQSGWVIPDGGSIVLVFSTNRVAGASTCWGRDLDLAGRRAMEKISLDLRGRLWWWPMLVTGPK